jgi:hypothetical protein
MHETMMTRRAMLASLTRMAAAASTIGLLLPGEAMAEGTVTITVYKDPSCGCCTKWVEHLRSAGLRPAVHDRPDMDGLKDSLGVPVALRSCHTAVAGRYVIEGHVPAADLKRLVASGRKDVLGLAVPDMPAGSPGMEVPGRHDRYDVIAFSPNGKTSVFAQH